MRQLKKHSIGFNTVSSVDGVISAQGVKSKPNNLEVFGYTHEVGESEKSPDNPYTLVSLDNGNVNLYDENNLSEIQITSYYERRQGLSLDYPKTGFYCIFYTKADSINAYDSIQIKFLYQDGTYQSWTTSCAITQPKLYEIPKNVEKVLIYNGGSDATSREFFDRYENLLILDSSIMPSEYITDEHSIVLSNNDTTIQVPVPIALNSVEGTSDYIYKNSDGVWKLKQNNSIIDNYNDETIPTSYISSTDNLGAGATIIYQLDSQITHILSDYAQDLLNSFTLKNQNEIYVEGYPDLKVSGYIQK